MTQPAALIASEAQRGVIRQITLAALDDPLGVQPVALRLYRNLDRGLKQIERALVRAAEDEAIMVTAAGKVRRPERGELSGSPRTAADATVLYLERLTRRFLIEEAEGSGEDAGYVERNLDAAYKLGMRSAFDHAGTASQLRSQIRRLPSHRSAVRAAERSTLDYITKMNGGTKRGVYNDIVRGLANRESPSEIADRMAARLKITRNRAATIAQTEVVRAHAQGSLNTLRSLRFERVTAKVEFALNQHGSAQPCQECQGLAGVVYTIDEAEGLIPVHPRCQCGWIPVIES